MPILIKNERESESVRENERESERTNKVVLIPYNIAFFRIINFDINTQVVMAKLFTLFSFVKRFSPFINKMKAFLVHIYILDTYFSLNTHFCPCPQKLFFAFGHCFASKEIFRTRIVI